MHALGAPGPHLLVIAHQGPSRHPYPLFPGDPLFELWGLLMKCLDSSLEMIPLSLCLFTWFFSPFAPPWGLRGSLVELVGPHIYC